MIKTKCFCFLYAIWPQSKDLYPTYLKATKPPSVWDIHLVTNKTLKMVTPIAMLACIDVSLISNFQSSQPASFTWPMRTTTIWLTWPRRCCLEWSKASSENTRYNFDLEMVKCRGQHSSLVAHWLLALGDCSSNPVGRDLMIAVNLGTKCWLCLLIIHELIYHVGLSIR